MATRLNKSINTAEAETLQNYRPKKIILLVIILLIAIGATAGAAYYYYKRLNDFKSNPQKMTQEDTKTLVEKISKLIVLPTDEQPTVATVADPERLKDQPFFANAKKGDKVLIYTNAKKAILYDPVENKIVEVAPLNIGNTAGATTTPAK